MAGGQKLNDAEVVRLQQQMDERYQNIVNRVRKLQGTIDSLEGQWQGIGRAAFDKKQMEINQSMAAIGKILADVIEAMTKTRNIKDSTEDDVMSNVNRIDVGSSAIAGL